jgi:hypothetical protein
MRLYHEGSKETFSVQAAGGDLAYHIIILNHYDVKIPHLPYYFNQRKQNSLAETLIKDQTVRARLDNFVELIINKWERSYQIEEGNKHKDRFMDCGTQ